VIRRLARALRRNVVLLLLCLAAALAAAYVVTEQQTPQYASTVRVVVSAVPVDDDGQPLDEPDAAAVTISEERAGTYREVAESQVLATRVAARLLGDPEFRSAERLEPDDLQGKVSAEVVPGSAVLAIRVTDPDPSTAQLIAQAYAEELIAAASDVETGELDDLVPATDEEPGFAVVDFASFDDDPVSPDPLRNLLLAGGAGLLLGLLLTALRESLMTAVRTSEEVTALTGAPVLASIALESSKDRRALVTELDHQSPRVEGFRMLRTGVQFADPDAPHKLVVVTSSVAEEGKSSTAVNLALTLSRAGVRTLLVDGDLRRPQVAATFDIDGSAGVTTVLLGKVDLEDAVWTHPDSGLAVLPSGVVPPNPAELLQTKAMSHLLDRLRAAYQVVVVDCAPLNPVTDASLLAARADGVLLVVRHGRTTKDQLRTAVERLRQVGATTLGVALNGVPVRRRDAGYGGYGRDVDARTGRSKAPKAPKPPKPPRRVRSGAPSRRAP
jgi:receptor protein-tyrosine kinase